LEDTIASLRTGLMVVGVIAVAALGVAIYALVSGGTSGGSQTDERLSQIETRVNSLSRQVENPATSGGAGDPALGGRVEALERAVKMLAERPATDPTKAIEELSARIDSLSKDIEQLKQTQTQTTP
jgi:outer membrane murein-binding lipoprotein Lpp